MTLHWGWYAGAAGLTLALGFHEPGSAQLMAAAGGRSALPGPVPAIVERVVDGDTLDVRAQVWLGQEIFVRVRIRGLDTPELRGACAAESAAARAVQAWLVRRVEGRAVALTNITHDKWGGRVVADVADGAGAVIAAELIASGQARAYEGGQRTGWC